MERDKFLTEAMGECWHEPPKIKEELAALGVGCVSFQCMHCGKDMAEWEHIDFSTWPGFGKLWAWAHEQEWWQHFHDKNHCYAFTWEALKSDVIDPELIDPDYFANAVYEFLKGRE